MPVSNFGSEVVQNSNMSNGTEVLEPHPIVTAPTKKPVAPLACVACRSKHLKCNGVKPCSRCVSQKLDCSFLRSRRGYKGTVKAKTSVAILESPGNVCSEPTAVNLFGDSSSLGGATMLPRMTQEVFNVATMSENSPSSTFSFPYVGNRSLVAASVLPTHKSSIAGIKERCIEAFFYFTHPTHPFLLPKPHMINLLRTRYLPYLETAMCYLGSFHVHSAPRSQLVEEAAGLLSSHACPRDGFAVQANLLLAIGLDGESELKRSQIFLTRAEDIALEIGMNQRDFAILNGQGAALAEESWRRTWWELFVIGGMIAGVHQQSSFRLNDVPSSVALPCEEHNYEAGQIPSHSRSMEDVNDVGFLEEVVVFSSFTYRIIAIQNMGRILGLQQIISSDDPKLFAADAHLVNWILHLPPSKKLVIEDGRVDEMLFQANMITNASSILLHRKLSRLDSTAVQRVTSCAPHQAIEGQPNFNIHAAKTIKAAENISKLITLPVPLNRHTSFFTCVITLASIVHLSCWAALAPLGQDEHLKQQIRLNTGALKGLANIWPCAQRVELQVKGVAQEVFASRKLAAEEGFWNTFTNDEVLRSLIEDENIIHDF